MKEKPVTPIFLITPVLLICGGLLFSLLTDSSPKVAPPKQTQALLTTPSRPTLPAATATRPPMSAPSPTSRPGFTATAQSERFSIPSLALPIATLPTVVQASPELLPIETEKAKDAVERGLVVLPPYLKGENSRWIDLNLSDGFTRLMEGRKILRELPSAWGYGKPGSADDYFSTPPGTYYIYEKRDELHYDETYTTGYFRGWVGFDPERANGFHSFILDRQEKIIDARIGPVSHGCVRTEDWRTVYDFAQLAMAVTVHT